MDFVPPFLDPRTLAETANAVPSPALERLGAEHQEVLARLTAFEADLAANRSLPGAHAFLAFIEAEVWTHFRVEEEALFPLLDRIFPAENAPVVGGPVFVLTEEHSVLRRLVARLGDRVRAWESAGAPPEDFDLVARQTVRAFQKHVYKEDNIVFRLAAMLLPPEDKAALEDAAGRVLGAA